MTPEQWIEKRKQHLVYQHEQFVARMNNKEASFTERHHQTLRNSRSMMLLFAVAVSVMVHAFWQNKFVVCVLVGWLLGVWVTRYFFIVRFGKKSKKEINDMRKDCVDRSWQYVQQEMTKLEKLRKEIGAEQCQN